MLHNPSNFTALVGFSGPAGVNHDGILWELIFSVIAYKNNDGIVHQKEMTVYKPMKYEELRGYYNKINELEIISFTGEIEVIDSVTRIKMHELIGHSITDPSFNNILAEAKKTVVHSHPVFGELTLDKRYNFFESKIKLYGCDIDLRLDCNYGHTVEQVIEKAEIFWNEKDRWLRELYFCVTNKMLDLYNVHWSEDGAPRETAESFWKRLTLTSFTIDGDGNLTAWINDDDMFAGHDIEVSGSLTEGFTNASLAG